MSNSQDVANAVGSYCRNGVDFLHGHKKRRR